MNMKADFKFCRFSQSLVMRILYLPGPIDALQTYNSWLTQEEDSSSVAISYLWQFFDLCQELNAEALVLSMRKTDENKNSSIDSKSLDEETLLNGGKIKIQYFPALFQASSCGILFHLGKIIYLLRLCLVAIIYRADAVVITPARGYLFVLAPLTWLGIKVIPTLHCTFWPKFSKKNSAIDQKLVQLSGNFIKNHCEAVLAFPGEVTNQVSLLTGGSKKILNFLPTYRKQYFSQVDPPNPESTPFHILFLGRVTREKGVYTLVEIAQKLRTKGTESNFVFDICGDGPELEALQKTIKDSKLDSVIQCHGFCNRDKVLKMFGKSHVVIVPTTASFIEGFNKVVAEGVLAGRPVITSAVCPALNVVGEAVVEVGVESVEEYTQALLNLKGDQEFYRQKLEASLSIQDNFYNFSYSWSEQLKKALKDSVISER